MGVRTNVTHSLRDRDGKEVVVHSVPHDDQRSGRWVSLEFYVDGEEAFRILPRELRDLADAVGRHHEEGS